MRCLILVAFLLSPLAAHPATLVFSDGKLVGATAVNVNGALFDVAFVEGTCVGLYSGCELWPAPSPFPFGSGNASSATWALRQQVFVEVFDDGPDLVFGCTNPLACGVLTPFSNLDLAVGASVVDISSDSLTTSTQPDINPLGDTGTNDAEVFAVWSPHAGLSTADLVNPDDQLLLRDSNSGLEWLDVDQALGLSYDEVGSGAGGWTALGFRHANTSEVAGLFAAVAITPNSTLWEESNYVGALTLRRYLGCTVSCASDPSHSVAVADADPPSPISGASVVWGVYDAPGAGQAFGLGGSTHPKGLKDPYVGHFLVRPLQSPAECEDRVDNDNDGFVDWDGAGVGNPDPHCTGPDDDRESPNPVTTSCGLGAELVPLLGVGLWHRARRRQK